MVSAPEQPPSPPPTPWQRIFNWLWRIMAILWSVIIAGIAFSTIANIFTTPTATPLSQLYVIHWITIYHIPLFFVAGGLLLLTIISWIGSHEHKTSSVPSLDQEARLIILQTLREAYTYELDASLQGLTRIPLGLHKRFDLTHLERLSTWQPRQPEQVLPADTTIVDAYKGNGLLILGEPGAGKSTLLYDLAQALLSQAEQDESKPLPVILNLSSWATRQLRLEQWLIEELQRRYLIPRQQGQRWLQQAKLLPLLDGLDEVAPSACDTCIKAINTYQSEHLVPLVVCSRREEYQAMSERLTLQSAVIIQPLSSEQVKDYLARAGEALAVVQIAMHTNPVLQELLTTPLMLSVVMLTYKDKTAKDLPHGSPEEQQQQIFEHYITQALEKKRERAWRYAPQPTRKWLSWLAQQIQQRNLTQFYLEYLNPSWLPTKRAQILSRWFVGLVLGLVLILVLGLILTLRGGLGVVLVFGLLIGLAVGGLGWLLVEQDSPQEEKSSEIPLPQVLKWSWKRFCQGLGFGLLFGLGFGLLFGLTLGMGFGLVVVLVFGLLVGLGVGLSSISLNESMLVKPNQGISNSGWTAIRVGLLVGLGFGVVVGLFGGLGFGVVFGLLAGLLSGLVYGGRAYLVHYSVRFLLWQSGVIPWHAVRFLNEATERVLLQSVGGGYRFIHPLFQQYFASLYIASPSTSTQSPPSPQV